MTDDPLEVTVHIQAAPETLFDYFTDPLKYVQWMGASARLDAVPDGEYFVRMREGVETSGRFLDVDPPKRIVFTWGWNGDAAVPPGASRVEVTFQPDDTGTLVTLRHHGLPSAEQREHHRQGWELYLARLTTRANGNDPGPDPNA